MNSTEQRAQENQDAETPLRAGGQNSQYLTFIMAGEEYGVDILQVQEIRGWESVTPIPNAPAHIKGVINLRGTIVPIVDLRQRFGLQRVDYGPLTVVIVLKVATKKGSRVMGIVVDAVSDVYSLAAEEMKAAPDLGDNVNTSYIQGLVNVAGKMVILLDINELLGSDTIPDVSALQELKNLSDSH